MPIQRGYTPLSSCLSLSFPFVCVPLLKISDKPLYTPFAIFRSLLELVQEHFFLLSVHQALLRSFWQRCAPHTRDMMCMHYAERNIHMLNR